MKLRVFLWYLFSSLLFLALIGCRKNYNGMPVYGTIIWNIGSARFVGNSFAIAGKTPVGSSGFPEGSIYGMATKDNTLEILLAPLQGVATYTAGGPVIKYNRMSVFYEGKEYRADMSTNSTMVTIRVIKENNKGIAGTFIGDLSAITGEAIMIHGSFDLIY
jgi:hypothetical protein